MIIKNFVIDTLDDVESTLNRNLGPEAILLYTRETPSGQIEVSAGVEEEDFNEHLKEVSKEDSDDDFADEETMPDYDLSKYAPKPLLSTDSEELSRMVQHKVSTYIKKDEERKAQVVQSILPYLLSKGIASDVAEDIQKSFPPTQRSGPPITFLKENSEELRVLKKIIAKKISTKRINTSADEGQSVFIALGEGGMSKISALAKLAEEWRKRPYEDMALISFGKNSLLESYQSATLANYFNLSHRSVETVEELFDALKRYRDYKLVIIDPVINVMSDDYDLLRDLQRVMQQLKNVHVHLVVSAAAKDEDLKRVNHFYRLLNPETLIFTKVDSTSTPATILNSCCAFKKPISYISFGADIQEVIKEADPDSIANYIFN